MYVHVLCVCVYVYSNSTYKSACVCPVYSVRVAILLLWCLTVKAKGEGKGRVVWWTNQSLPLALGVYFWDLPPVYLYYTCILLVELVAVARYLAVAYRVSLVFRYIPVSSHLVADDPLYPASCCTFHCT